MILSRIFIHSTWLWEKMICARHMLLQALTVALYLSDNIEYHSRRTLMSFEEKFDNAKDKIAGKAKELEGKITGDKAREVEGKTQNVKGEAKDDVQKVRDVAHDDVDAVKDALKNKKDNLEK